MAKKIYITAMSVNLFLCYPKAMLTGISLPSEMINAANSLARIKRSKKQQWHCHVVAAHTRELVPMELAKGIHIAPSYNLANAPVPDRIFLPPIWGNPDVVVDQSPELLDWLEKAYRGGTQICAGGTAVCFLAKIGLLDNKIATTHWYYFDQLEQKYPKVNLQRHHFITQADNIICTASVNSLVDLTLYFIEDEFGVEVSRVIEQHFNHEINRTYDKPWFANGSTRHPDERIIEVQQWMQSHYAIPFNLKALADLANMSQRNFTRRFKSAVGQSALAYGIELKMKASRELLKDTNLSTQDIADQVGFKDSAYFSRIFKQKNNLTPGEYRKMVRGKLFNTTQVNTV